MTKKRIYLFLLVCATALFCGIRAQEIQTGIASFYGNNFHGRMTSSGVPYDKNSMMCAHRTLPFGTKIKVRNTTNDKEIVVTVTDRGPFVKGRVVDLSYAAAEALGIVRAGLAKVEISEFTHADADRECLKLPQLLFFDPKSGDAYTLAEWKARNVAAKDELRKQEIKQRQAAFLAKIKQQEPRYSIHPEQLTAMTK